VLGLVEGRDTGGGEDGDPWATIMVHAHAACSFAQSLPVNPGFVQTVEVQPVAHNSTRTALALKRMVFSFSWGDLPQPRMVRMMIPPDDPDAHSSSMDFEARGSAPIDASIRWR
jgi:hypothetical protein